MPVIPSFSSTYPGLDARRSFLTELTKFQSPSSFRGAAQTLSTFLPPVAVPGGMYAALSFSVWISLALAPAAAALLVRIFIIQHDCGHCSLFRARMINDWVGRECRLVTLAPFANWRRQHAAWNNVDARPGGANIHSGCLTVAEYRALPRRRRLFHRVAIHPPVLFLAYTACHLNLCPPCGTNAPAFG
jgi:omega-6 fatty acid desaturase (delta-12 desaturase)